MVKLITVKLHIPNGQNIVGVVQCHERNESEQQIPHKTSEDQKKLPGTHWEIEVSDLIPQILPKKSAKDFSIQREKQEKEDIVRGLHIEIGMDLRPYIRIPDLPEENMIIPAIKIWLVHQALYNTEGIDFGHFKEFVLHDNQDFEEWLTSRSHIHGDQKAFLRTKESLFKRVREIYREELQSEHSDALVAAIVARVTGISITTKVIV